jgi:hypothetical protein
VKLPVSLECPGLVILQHLNDVTGILGGQHAIDVLDSNSFLVVLHLGDNAVPQAITITDDVHSDQFLEQAPDEFELLVTHGFHRQMSSAIALEVPAFWVLLGWPLAGAPAWLAGSGPLKDLSHFGHCLFLPVEV